MRKPASDRVDLEHQVRMFRDVIKDMKARQIKPGHCQRIADYEQIVAELNEALADMPASHLH
ncbi:MULTISPECIES: hypothetical protein [Neorhizobium]|uniref:hypothetical protein n=1 Tax=Neorhizobium sp. T6_25 TaxID=2093833 RepID=UPI000CF907B2|nr:MULTISPECIES: hypothetical protein [Neorhizobium]